MTVLELLADLILQFEAAGEVDCPICPHCGGKEPPIEVFGMDEESYRAEIAVSRQECAAKVAAQLRTLN